MASDEIEDPQEIFSVSRQRKLGKEFVQCLDFLGFVHIPVPLLVNLYQLLHMLLFTISRRLHAARAQLTFIVARVRLLYCLT